MITNTSELVDDIIHSNKMKVFTDKDLLHYFAGTENKDRYQLSSR